MTQFAWAGVAFVVFLVLAVGLCAIGLWYLGPTDDDEK